MADWIDKLSELRRLQESGAIEAAEFNARRADIYAERDAARPVVRSQEDPPAAASPVVAPSTFEPGQQLGAQLPSANSSIPIVNPPPAQLGQAPKSDQRWLWIGLGGAAALLALVIAVAVLHPFGAMSGSRVQTFYVNRLAHLRSAPTAIGSIILGDLRRGDVVTGMMVTGNDGQTQWLKVSSDGQADRYVWSADLSATPRPSLIGGVHMVLVVTAPVSLYADPSTSAPLVENEPAGAQLHVVGEVAGGWQEVQAEKGGVGYMPPSIAPAAPAETVAASTADGSPPMGDVTAAQNEARSLTEAYFSSWSGSDSDSAAAVRQYFAPTVNFYGTTTDINSVMATKMKFAARWPLRHYTVREQSLQVNCSDARTCVVQGVADWDDSDPLSGRRSAGVSSFSLGFQDSLIVSENSSTLSRNSNFSR